MIQEYVEELRTLAGTIVSRDRIVQEVTEMDDGTCAVRTVLRESLPMPEEGEYIQDMPIYERIGMQLRSIRLDACMTLEEVGKACGMSRQAVSSIERGRKACSVKTAHRIASALGYDITFRRIRHGQSKDHVGRGSQ